MMCQTVSLCGQDVSGINGLICDAFSPYKMIEALINKAWSEMLVMLVREYAKYVKKVT